MFRADDYRMRAKALSDTLQETKEALDIDELRQKLSALKAEQEKPEVWGDLELSTKLGREISSVEGKVASYDKGKKALEEVNEVIDLRGARPRARRPPANRRKRPRRDAHPLPPARQIR